MKVLQVSPSYYPAIVYGGPIFSVHYTCQALARHGVQVFVATTNANGNSKLDVPTDKAVAFEPNYSVRYYDDSIINRFSWAFTLNLWRDIERADVVHLQDVLSAHAVETLILTKAFAKPILISPRGAMSSWALNAKRPRLKRAWLRLLVRPFVGNTQRVAWHATSEKERDEILSIFPGSAVRFIPNAIDCTRFDGNTLPRQDYLARFFPGCQIAPASARIVTCLGRLHSVKGFDTAIQAFAAVREAFPDVVLLIAGRDDGERAHLQGLIDRLGLQGCAAIVGEVSGAEMIAFLKGGELFLFPSHTENFGMACLEALAAGLPVIASRDTPWPEIESAGCGRWIDNTVDAFEKSLSELLAVDLTVMRQKARAYAARYDLSAIAAQFIKIYGSLAHDQRR